MRHNIFTVSYTLPRGCEQRCTACPVAFPVVVKFYSYEPNFSNSANEIVYNYQLIVVHAKFIGSGIL